MKMWESRYLPTFQLKYKSCTALLESKLSIFIKILNVKKKKKFYSRLCCAFKEVLNKFPSVIKKMFISGFSNAAALATHGYLALQR